MTDRADDPSTDSDGGADDATAEAVVESLPADEAFELLGNDTRLSVLRVLFDADGPLPFSELREAAGMRDSGQFNYHLERLVGSFVERREAGYEITTAGAHLVGAVLAGQYTKAVERTTVEVGTPCPECGTPLQGVFESGYGQVRCGSCDRKIISLPVPPGVYEDYPREEWPFVAERWARWQAEKAASGFCFTCHGPMTSRLETDFDAIDAFDSVPESFAAVELYTCQRCGESMYSNAEASVLTHPAVVAFHHDHGIDVTATPIWELDWAVEPRAEVVAETPLRVEFTVELDDEALAIVIGDDGEVVETRRAARGESSGSRGGT